MFHQFQWSFVRLLGLGALAVSLVPTSGISQAQACIGCAVNMIGNQGFISCSETGGDGAQNCTTNNGVCTLGGSCHVAPLLD
ncbi:MAG TPA: hypothetical protein VI685_21955 [Candidatus Angelobacter sp.]